ncbi:hypothetical protein [Amnibacterium kyonggiense]|uniref:Uncharacterized protein n=1 Tax=Amnibacterium kyonggiense TaxID=595671 RepID=A0A4R7FKN0_9MICO|nr:hypothetical protein [Amnibacterium kyonggiense]TDS76916.1 hypothetical protein CLV52_1855 [Amnibacterium kyonggiense]
MARTAAPDTATTIGGAAVAAAGPLALTRQLDVGDVTALLLLAEVALAVGCGLLAARRIVDRSRAGVAALIVTGLGPLLFRLAPVPGVAVGMTLLWLVTAATVVAAVEIARTTRLGGVARWAFVVVAADALLVAVMSTVPLGAFPLAYVDWHLDAVRPVALLVWGVAVAVQPHLPAIRRRAGAVDTAWRESTTVGGASETRDSRERVPHD